MQHSKYFGFTAFSSADRLLRPLVAIYNITIALVLVGTLILGFAVILKVRVATQSDPNNDYHDIVGSILAFIGCLYLFLSMFTYSYVSKRIKAYERELQFKTMHGHSGDAVQMKSLLHGSNNVLFSTLSYEGSKSSSQLPHFVEIFLSPKAVLFMLLSKMQLFVSEKVRCARCFADKTIAYNKPLCK